MLFENGVGVKRISYLGEPSIAVGRENVASMEIALDGSGHPWVKLVYDDGCVVVHNTAHLAALALEDNENQESKEYKSSKKFHDNKVKFSNIDVGTKFKWPLSEDATTYTKFCNGSGRAAGSRITVGLLKLDPFVYPIDESEEHDGSRV